MLPDQSRPEIKRRIFLLSLTLAFMGAMMLGLVGFAIAEIKSGGSFPLAPLFIIIVLAFITNPLLRLYHEERKALARALEREKFK
jgi:ABC-type spermidine/putrescine transport system permease subunit I